MSDIKTNAQIERSPFFYYLDHLYFTISDVSSNITSISNRFHQQNWFLWRFRLPNYVIKFGRRAHDKYDPAYVRSESSAYRLHLRMSSCIKRFLESMPVISPKVTSARKSWTIIGKSPKSWKIFGKINQKLKDTYEILKHIEQYSERRKNWWIIWFYV